MNKIKPASWGKRRKLHGVSWVPEINNTAPIVLTDGGNLLAIDRWTERNHRPLIPSINFINAQCEPAWVAMTGLRLAGLIEVQFSDLSRTWFDKDLHRCKPYIDGENDYNMLRRVLGCVKMINEWSDGIRWHKDVIYE